MPGGTDGTEIGNSIAIFDTKQLYMVGSASTYTLPLACPTAVGGTPYCKNNNSNSQDAFITRFDMSSFVGINEIPAFNSNNQLFVYPNPSNNNINIIFKAKELDNYNLEIYNMLGQVVYKKDLGKTFGEHNEMVDVSNYSEGMYIINLISSKEILSTKVIKK
ncbi:MAG: T9SS type A sorting domain-containing protein [Bacteroidia bacterium]